MKATYSPGRGPWWLSHWGVGQGRGLAPLAQTYHMGALRFGLAIGEVQALLNPPYRFW